MGTRRRGRPESSVDPEAGPIQAFASGLRQLRVTADLTYRQLGKATNYAPHTLSRAADGTRLPSRELTRAFVTACGGDPEEWELRRRAVERWLDAQTSGEDGTPPSGPGPGTRLPTLSQSNASRPAPSGEDPGVVIGLEPITRGTADEPPEPVGDGDGAAPSMHVAPTAADLELINSPEQFAMALDELRRGSALTIRQIARDAAVPRGTVHDYLAGSHLPQPTNLDPLKRVLIACGESSPDRIEAWMAALSRARRPGRRSVYGAQPYRGLASFGQEDAAWFRGREELTALIVRRVSRLAAEGGGPLVVVGPSGAGKSSLLRAGVIPALNERGLKPVLFTPGSEPLSEVGSALARIGGTTPRIVMVDQFEEIFADDVPEADRQEFIRKLCRPPNEDPANAPSLPASDGGLTVVLGMRADFYIHALRHPLLAAAMQDGQVVVGPMTKVELRRVIVEPARQAHLDVEDGLVEVALQELAPRISGAAHDPGALPLLSHTLRAVWERHRGGRLTLADYLAVGGIAGSVSTTADAVFAELSPPQQEVARRLFGRLVRTGEDSPDTRRRAPLTEIFGGRSEAETGDLQQVLDRFVGARLLTLSDDTIEISHEALLTAWPQLAMWIEADRDWLRRHRALAVAARAWRDAGRDPDLLYRGATLHILRRAVDDGARLLELNDVEREFFDTSVSQEADREARERRRLRRRFLFLTIVAVLGILAASVTVYAHQKQVMLQNEQTQSLSRRVANEADTLRSNDVSLSMQLALAAYRISPTPEALSSLLNSTGLTADTRALPAGGAQSIAASGTLIAASTRQGTVQLYTAARGGLSPIGPPLAGARGALNAVAFSADGRLLAAGGEDAQVHIWDVSNPTGPVPLPTLTGPDTKAAVTSLTVSADGRKLAAGYSDRTIRLWDLRTPVAHIALTVASGPGTINSLAVSVDGRILAAASGAAVRLWDVSDPEQAATLGTLAATTADKIFAVAFSPDGRTLAAGTSQHGIYLWDTSDPAHPRQAGSPLTGPASWVNTVAFSPDGHTLAAGSSDDRLWIFDLATREPVTELAHPAPVTAAIFLSDGTPVTATVDDGTIRWWHLPGPLIAGFGDSIFATAPSANGGRLGVSPGANGNTLTLWNIADSHNPTPLGSPVRGGSGGSGFSGSAALTPDGRVFYGGDADGTVQVWDFTDPRHPVEVEVLSAARALVESLSTSPDGRMLAIGADDGNVRLYDITNPRHPIAIAAIHTPNGDTVYQAAFAPLGHLLAVADSDGNAYLYDITDPSKPILRASLRSSGSVESAAFSLDGRTLAVGSADGAIRVWNVANPARPQPFGSPLAGPTGHISSLAYSPTGMLAASGTANGAIWLWDMTDPAHPTYLASLNGPSTGVFSAAFAQDGRVLVGGGVNGTVQLWNTDASAAAAWICSVVGQPLTQWEWAKYIPDRAYNPPCSAG